MVREAVVLGMDHPTLGEEVVAVISLTENVSAPALRRHLLDLGIGTAVPKRFFQIEELPRTPTTKVDRHLLKQAVSRYVGANAPEQTTGVELSELRLRNHDQQAPGPTWIDGSVAQCWHRVVGRRPCSFDDDFFLDAGGDSLGIARLIVEVFEDTGLLLSPEEVLVDPTPAGIAGALSTRVHELAASSLSARDTPKQEG